MQLGDRAAMSTASVLIAADPTTPSADTPRYTLLLSTDSALIEAAQRLRHDVFTSEPGFEFKGDGHCAGLDADRFDEHCDHLLVREDNSGELVGCYRMLPPPGAIAAGGLYTATEFDVTGLDPLRPSLVEMGRAVVREDHRNGGVVLLMWAGILAYLDRCGYDYVTGCVSFPVQGATTGGAGGVRNGGVVLLVWWGILAYLDRCGYDYVTGCVSVPVQGSEDEVPGSQIRAVRDFVRRRHAAPAQYTGFPSRPGT